MFRGMHSDGLYSKEEAAPAAAHSLGVTTLRHANQESPWIGILSVVSRPALAFLQKYLPGKPRTTTTPSGISDWEDGEVKLPFKGKNAFLDQLDDLIPETEHHLAYHLHYQSGNLTNGFDSSTTALGWLSADSLRELGIHDSADLDLNMRQGTSGVGYLASAKNFLSQVLVNAVSGQDVTVKNPERHRGLGRDDWPSDSVASRVKSNWWWDGIWGSADGSQGWLSGFSWRNCSVASDQHCRENDSGLYCQQAESGTAARVAKPTELFEQRDYGEPTHGESTGPSSNKGAPGNASPHSIRPESLPSSEKPLLVCQPPCERLTSIRSATACSEVAVLTPDQDNGYSSLEEEHSNSRMHLVDPLRPEQGCSEPGEGAEELVLPAEGSADAEVSAPLSDAEVASGGREEEEATHDSDLSDFSDTEDEAQPEVQTPPQTASPGCQNKAIAYIMGEPCSESESDLEDDGDWDSEDDDGFDSEGSSIFSDSEDLADEEEEEEEEEEGEDEEGKESDGEQEDGEAERLWNSLCRSGDPYDPRNFTAALQTAPRRAPRDADPPAEASSSPQPLLLEEDSWEEEGSDVDEAESLRLWNSFSSAGDPYSPLNFQGALWTRQEARVPRKRLSLPVPPSPYLRRDPEEDRMDSGFSDVLPTLDQTATPSTKLKKVRFAEEVEEFYASGDEDRRGPWEELARDRCRFGRRVQETERAIGYCLAPAFRTLAFLRLRQAC